MPGKTGPVTVEGKTRARANSTGYGLRSTRVLSCRREKCIYFQTCEAPNRLSEKWAKQVYGDPCLLETDLMEKWRASDYRWDRFDPDKPEVCQVLESLIIATVLKNRAERAIGVACNCDIVQAQLIFMDIAQSPDQDEVKKLYSYYLRAKGRWWTAFKRAAPYLRGMIEVEKYKLRCLQSFKKSKSAT